VSALRIAGLRWPWPCVWLLACAAVLALDPWALLQAGFWLSFVAVAVLFAAGSMPLQGGIGSTRVMAAAWRMCREQWAVTLALAPLGALLFQQLSLIGLVANALAIPWVTLVVTPLAMAGIALRPLWDVAASAAQVLGAVLQWLAALPGASVALAAPPLWAAAAGVLGGVLLVMRLPWSLRLGGLPLLLVALLWQPARPPHGQFDLLAADIGQGNAVLVRTAHHSLLYDAGPAYGPRNDAGRRVLVPLLRALDERLDLLLLSHRDSDHTGGAAAVLEAQPAAQLLASIEPAHPLQSLRPAQRCEAGQQWTWDGVHFEVLYPAAADYAAALPPNALSCVLRIDNGHAAALLAGDIGKAQERELVRRGAMLRADVLLVPHHGSAGSSGDELLDAVQPGVAWVQAGYRNRFGHPAPAVRQALRARGVPLVESTHCGAIRWHSQAVTEWHCERAERRRYWHPGLR